jgi:hypothetical protein
MNRRIANDESIDHSADATKLNYLTTGIADWDGVDFVADKATEM